MKEVVRNICLFGMNKHIEPVAPSAILGKGNLADCSRVIIKLAMDEDVGAQERSSLPSSEPRGAFCVDL